MTSMFISTTLLLAFAVFVNAMPHPPIPPHKQAALDACMKKLDITHEQFHEFHMRKVSGDVAKIRDCFGACMDKELGIMNAGGDINREEALKDFPPHVPQENRTRIIDACIVQKGADECETSKLFNICVKKWQPPVFDSKDREEFMRVYDECKDKLSVTDEDVKKMAHSLVEMETDCFGACVAKGMELMNEDGTFNKEVFVKKSPPHLRELAQKMADECEKEVAADECKSAVLMRKCFKNYDNEIVDQVYGAQSE